MVRTNLTASEKVAREAVGLEAPAKHFMMGEKNADDILKREAAEKFNTKVDEYVDKFNKHSERLSEYAQTVTENAANLEIRAIFGRVLVRPFNENPFQRIQVSDSGLILDLGGQKPEFKNQDNGQIEEEENIIKVATVIDVAPDCKYLKEGDTVMYTRNSSIPVPFFKQGLECISENRVVAVINEGLTKRWSE